MNNFYCSISKKPTKYFKKIFYLFLIFNLRISWKNLVVADDKQEHDNVSTQFQIKPSMLENRDQKLGLIEFELNVKNDSKIKYYEGNRDVGGKKIILQEIRELGSLKDPKPKVILRGNLVGKNIDKTFEANKNNPAVLETLKKGLNNCNSAEDLINLFIKYNIKNKSSFAQIEAGKTVLTERVDALEISLSPSADVERSSFAGYYVKSADILSELKKRDGSVQIDFQKAKKEILKSITISFLEDISEKQTSKVKSEEDKIINDLKEEVLNCQDCVMKADLKLGNLTSDMMNVVQKVMVYEKEKNKIKYNQIAPLYTLCLLRSYVQSCANSDQHATALLEKILRQHEKLEGILHFKVDCNKKIQSVDATSLAGLQTSEEKKASNPEPESLSYTSPLPMNQFPMLTPANNADSMMMPFLMMSMMGGRMNNMGGGFGYGGLFSMPWLMSGFGMGAINFGF